ncbi:uncharacterized protein FIBRA_08570 [Fibroporia radiculosa]|uniref:HMG box domain-containing protein n=1 Tax=Fibroporia radiculosa TaxID=599839 RepID=J4GHQ8_9APHY|nr:uncharacterized protein FIBRA_08570 [Fibroporia radiculosa]CCM06318.1 predicted protein [Fibroporia radiculosa]
MAHLFQTVPAYKSPVVWQPGTPGSSWSPSSSEASLGPSTPEAPNATRPHVTSPKGSPPPKRIRSPRGRAKEPGHIPRPPNAFVLYRAEQARLLKERPIENDQRKISEIVGAAWKSLDEEGKKPWRDHADFLKRMHALQHPNYRYRPVARTEKPRKRNVKRNGPQDKARCKAIGTMLGRGHAIDEIEKMSAQIAESMRGEAEAEASVQNRSGLPESDNFTTTVFDSKTWAGGATEPASPSRPCLSPFRSPLMAPAVEQPTSLFVYTAAPDAGPLIPELTTIELPALLQLPVQATTPDITPEIQMPSPGFSMEIDLNTSNLMPFASPDTVDMWMASMESASCLLPPASLPTPQMVDNFFNPISIPTGEWDLPESVTTTVDPELMFESFLGLGLSPAWMEQQTVDQGMGQYYPDVFPVAQEPGIVAQPSDLDEYFDFAAIMQPQFDLTGF